MSESPEPSKFVRAHVIVSGIVQGVGYRYATVQKVGQMGLNGWVQNLADGRVEAVFEGEPSAVEAMIAWCRQGPSAAAVRDVSVEMSEAMGLRGFEVRG